MSTILTDEQREMVLANVPLVEHIVNRVAINLPASHSRDDLVQTGILGLISATVRYDPDIGAAFSTFAGRRIEGAIIDMLRQSDWAPRSVRSMERRLSNAEEKLGPYQAATASRLSQELGCDVSQLDQLRRDIAKARLDSLDRPTGMEDGTIPLSATVVDQRQQAEEIVDQQELLGYLREGVSLLPQRHRMVVIGYYFEAKTITELGTLLGVTQSRASQIKVEALKLLRANLNEAYDEPEPPAPPKRQPQAKPDTASIADSSNKPEPAAEPVAEPEPAITPEPRPEPTSDLRTSREKAFADAAADSKWREPISAGNSVSVSG